MSIAMSPSRGKELKTTIWFPNLFSALLFFLPAFFFLLLEAISNNSSSMSASSFLYTCTPSCSGICWLLNRSLCDISTETRWIYTQQDSGGLGLHHYDTDLFHTTIRTYGNKFSWRLLSSSATTFLLLITSVTNRLAFDLLLWPSPYRLCT